MSHDKPDETDEPLVVTIKPSLFSEVTVTAGFDVPDIALLAPLQRAVERLPGVARVQVRVGWSDVRGYDAVVWFSFAESGVYVPRDMVFSRAVLSRVTCARYHNPSFAWRETDGCVGYLPTWTLEVGHIDVWPFAVEQLVGTARTAGALAAEIEAILDAPERAAVRDLFR